MTIAMAALATAPACSDGGSAPTATQSAAFDSAFEQVAAAEIVASGFIENLTDDQRAALMAAFERAHAALGQVFDRLRAGEIEPEQARSEAMAIHEALLSELAGFLSPEQLAALREARPQGSGRPRLGLTEEQRVAIQSIWDRLHESLQAIGARLDAGEIEPEQARSEAMAALTAAHEAFCGVLDASQEARVPFCSGEAPPFARPGPFGGPFGGAFAGHGGGPPPGHGG
jgi:hypothetical protein